MRLAEVVEASQRISATSKRTAKLGFITELLKRTAPEEVPVAVSFLSGELRQRKTNIGYATIRAAAPQSSPHISTLTLLDVDNSFEQIANVQAGTGSNRERERLLRELLARAAGMPLADIRRAHMLSGDLTVTAAAAFEGGTEALASFGIQLFRPLQPMLAQSADDVADALQRIGMTALEFKLDGARIQVHKRDDEVRISSRNLNEVTDAVPELAEVVRRLPARDIVLDGEMIAMKANGRPHDFQMTMKRFGSRRDIAKLQKELPVRAFFFDCLYRDGETLIDRPAAERFAALLDAVGEDLIAPRTVTDDVAGAEDFLQQALSVGHEGLVAKALDAPYEAGRRGASWIKIKVAKTLDLVVLAAEWGHGRRSRE